MMHKVDSSVSVDQCPRAAFAGEAPYPGTLHQATLDDLLWCGGEHTDADRMFFLKMVGHRGVLTVLNCRSVTIHSFAEGAPCLPYVRGLAGCAREEVHYIG